MRRPVIAALFVILSGVQPASAGWTKSKDLLFVKGGT